MLTEISALVVRDVDRDEALRRVANTFERILNQRYPGVHWHVKRTQHAADASATTMGTTVPTSERQARADRKRGIPH